MAINNGNLADRIVGHLLEIAESKCSITEEGILQEDDENVQKILAGLLNTFEALEYREQKLAQTLEEIKQLNERLDDRVEMQSHAIMELSTPVIQIWDDVLILPLIGTVDSFRAQQIVEQALEVVTEKQASVLIIDITGIPTIDTAVARHLLKTFDAVKLLGAHSILTGVSPHNAQTLVKLGVDLGLVMSTGSMQAGVKSALELTNRVIIKRDSTA